MCIDLGGLGICLHVLLGILFTHGDLGYSFDNLDESPPHEYCAAVKNLMSASIYPLSDHHLTLSNRPTIFKLPAAARRLIPYLTKLGPASFRRALLKVLPFSGVRKLREIVDTMDRTSVKIFQSKKATLQQGDEAILKEVGGGKDIISIFCARSSFACFAVQNSPALQ